jgi:hypothetical protein
VQVGPAALVSHASRSCLLPRAAPAAGGTRGSTCSLRDHQQYLAKNPFGYRRRANTGVEEYTVITLCGSMRFREELERLEAELTRAGHVVLTPTAVDPSTELDAEQRALLGRIHLQKIAMSDEVLIANVGDYVGGSTRREIEHARSRGIPVSFLEPHATTGVKSPA